MHVYCYVRHTNLVVPMHLFISWTMTTTELLILLSHFRVASSLLWPVAQDPATVNAVLKNSSCQAPLSFQQFENSTMTCVRFDGNKKLKDAITECQKIYAYPACATTQSMLKAVSDLSIVQSYLTFMIGATLDNNTGQWVCSNGRKITSSETLGWNVGEPSRGASETCMQLAKLGTNYGISDTTCSSESPYMCEFSISCDNAQPSDFYHVGNYSYCFNSVLATYAEAEEICGRFGAKLACPRDSNTTAFFQRVALARGMPNVYLGVTDLEQEGTFRCADGSTPTISDWYSGEPNGEEYENYLALAKSTGYKVADYIATQHFYSICEIPYSGKVPI